MLSKIANYKGVIIFYLLLAFGLFAVSYHTRIYDSRIANSELSIVTNNN